MWSSVLPEQIFVPEPPAIGSGDAVLDAYIALIDDEIGSHAGELAAVIVEPVVQGAGGMRFHDPRLLRALREIRRRP